MEFNMSKIKLGVIFGGMSTEREVSCISATSVIKNLNKDKYNIFQIFIDKDGKWFEVKNIEKIYETKKRITNICEYLKELDLVFPVLHGLYGEDGTIQGMLEMLKIHYVGCGVLASSLGMNKACTKIIFEKARINQAKYVYLKKVKDKYFYVDEELNENQVELKKIDEIVSEKIGFPLFVKPANSGSSVGVSKVENNTKLENAIEEAGQFDKEILIEKAIVGKEVECSVIGNQDMVSSCVGEIVPAEVFYSYNAKYKDENSKIIIPANISKEKEEEIRKLAVKAFKAIGGKGLSRVDFFVEEKTDKVYINEINTMPGFTNISMFPKLFENSGIEYTELLDRLIDYCL